MISFNQTKTSLNFIVSYLEIGRKYIYMEIKLKHHILDIAYQTYLQ
jgi:hypothetical protein